MKAKNDCFFQSPLSDMNTFHNYDKKFIIKMPNTSARLTSRLNTKRNDSIAKTFLIGSHRNINLSTGKQSGNVTINHSTSRNLQKENSVCLTKKFLSPRNYSVSKLKKYRFRKQTIQDQTEHDFVLKKDNCVEYCRIKILTQNNQNQHQVIDLKVKVSSTTNLQQLLKSKLKNRNCVGFQVQPHNLLLDLYLTLDYCNISYLNGTSLQLSVIERMPCHRVSISSFQIFKCIGTGGFSKVFLCRFKEDGKFYALKLIDKRFILKHKKNKIVMNQRNIMESINHPFVIKMKFAFQTANNLAFVLQYCPGSEMFSIIKKYKKLAEDMARFYMIEILLGLQYLHSQGIIYRDFKPQNILVDINGHIKIADFGLAKPNYFTANDRAYSFCGSPEYMPPEMILKEGHSLSVDFYCLGAVLYEFVTGLPPFYSKDTNQIYDSTLNETISFPSRCKLSSELKNLLKGLLCKDQAYRLGSLHGVKQILAHPWFGKFSREEYLRKQIKPPTHFRQINSINIEPEELRQRNQIYVIEAKKQQQPEKLDFDVAFPEFYYDYRFLRYEEAKKTGQKWFKRKDSSQRLTNLEVSKNSLTLLQRIKSTKMMHNRLTKQTEQNNDRSSNQQHVPFA